MKGGEEGRERRDDLFVSYQKVNHIISTIFITMIVTTKTHASLSNMMTTTHSINSYNIYQY